MTDISFEDVCKAISAGVCDGKDDSVYAALKLRKNFLTSQKGLTITDKDFVRFNKSARPRYLVDATKPLGVFPNGISVKKVNAKSVILDLPDDPAFGRFAGSKDIRCPLAIVDKVS